MININEERSIKILLDIQKDLNNKEVIDIKKLDKNKTVLVNVDVINGFCKIGNLYSERTEKVINPVTEINKKMKDFKKIFFRDSHTENSIEFESYINHCVENNEKEIVDELKPYINENTKIFDKNSTNGFFAEKFKSWFDNNKEINTFVIVGDCTDICVMTFALSLKTYANQNNRKINIIIPTDAVETFNLDITQHDAELMNLFALYNMQMNGIKIIKNLK